MCHLADRSEMRTLRWPPSRFDAALKKRDQLTWRFRRTGYLFWATFIGLLLPLHTEATPLSSYDGYKQFSAGVETLPSSIRDGPARPPANNKGANETVSLSWIPTFPPLIIELRKESERAQIEQFLNHRTSPAQAAQRQNLVFGGLGAGIVMLGFMYNTYRTRRRNRTALTQLSAAKEQGLDEPMGMYPLIIASRCIGCGTCIRGCHSTNVLGILDGQSRMIAPANCVSCGCCAQNCPTQAVQLVFGTKKRPVEMPRLTREGQSNVPGLYIAGELGGMGLIANAMEQGMEVVTAIAADLAQQDTANDSELDLVIVGAGPAGLGASVKAQELGLRYRCVERGTWGGAVNAYPKGKLVMTRPIRLPLYGAVKLRETTKEALLEIWHDMVEKSGIQIQGDTEVTHIERRENGSFVARTTQGELVARRILLALGRAGTPRELGVSGEELPHVEYQLIDPEPYAGKRMIVIGGGDVACESALALADQPDAEVSLIYRGSALSRPKPMNRDRVEQACQDRRLELILNATISRIDESRLWVRVGDEPDVDLLADHILVCCGGVPPTNFLKEIGIEIISVCGEPLYS